MSGKINTPFTSPRVSWVGGSTASILFHAALVLPFIIHFSLKPRETPPAAVMTEYAPEFEVLLVRSELAPGVSQQRKVEQMTRVEITPDKEAPKRLEHPDAEFRQAVAKLPQRVKKTAEARKQSRHEQRAEAGNAAMTSLAAPPVQPALTRRNAAPLDTDAVHISASKISWEALVKGKINKMRNYPEDARRRKRSGTAMIAFSVNAHGEILSTQLVASSGTLSLDKAAISAVDNARPLPPPPQEILNNGVHKVTLPVEFGLLKI